MPKLLCVIFCAAVFFFFCSRGFYSQSFADEGDPVAIRRWPENGVTVETMWDLHIALRITDSNRSHLQRDADLELFNKELENNKDETKSTRQHCWANASGNDFTLDRKPNENEVSWSTASAQTDPSSNAVHVSHVLLGEGDSVLPITLITVDGVRILDSGDVGEDKLAAALRANLSVLKSLANIDVHLQSRTAQTAESLNSIVELLRPRIIVLAEGTELNLDDANFTKLAHNALAVSKSTGPYASTKWVAMTPKPWQMSNELADLFEKKKTACEDSRELFAKLSVKQLNFKPSNGTHTPRWNTEHMMARELLYFSQFYNGVDPSVPVMNINPKQMPDDYQFKHPDWTGDEEARQTGRVQAFTRRFAYLLEGLDLDTRPKGSRNWTPRALLKQMDRHYTEHTENVRKKMKLSEWPDK